MNEDLQSGKADIIGIGYNLKQEYFDRGWLATPIILRDQYMLIVREQTESSKDPFGAFKIFNWSLWTAIFCAFSFFEIFEGASNKLYKRDGKVKTNIGGIKELREKVLFTGWSLIFGVLLGVFTNV